MNIYKTAILILVFFLLGSGSYGQNFPDQPNPPRLVNDFASVLSGNENQRLEDKLTAFDDSTSSQIAIVTIKSLEGYDVSDYAFNLAEEWGIGQQGKDNGILILVALDDRKMFIATGYGVEAHIPDVYAFRIVDRILKPNFRNQDYYKGLDEATDRLMALISGEFDAALENGNNGTRGRTFLIIFIAFVIFIIIISRRKGGGNNNRGRGLFPTTTLGNPYRSGSGWGNFSSGSGSFGGFGGGSFGGGGAGGSW